MWLPTWGYSTADMSVQGWTNIGNPCHLLSSRTGSSKQRAENAVFNLLTAVNANAYVSILRSRTLRVKLWIVLLPGCNLSCCAPRRSQAYRLRFAAKIEITLFERADSSTLLICLGFGLPSSGQVGIYRWMRVATRSIGRGWDAIHHSLGSQPLPSLSLPPWTFTFVSFSPFEFSWSLHLRDRSSAKTLHLIPHPRSMSRLNFGLLRLWSRTDPLSSFSFALNLIIWGCRSTRRLCLPAMV